MCEASHGLPATRRFFSKNMPVGELVIGGLVDYPVYMPAREGKKNFV